jgi:hypothetical protein
MKTPKTPKANSGSCSANRPVGRVGMYLCHACGEYIERESNDGKTLKKWRKSYCEKTGKNVRVWLKLEHNIPHRHSSPNAEVTDGGREVSRSE